MEETMSHYLDAKAMLNDDYVGPFVREALYQVFKDGYEFQDPQYPDDGPGVEIFIKQIDDKKSLLFAAAMRVIKIPFWGPCGVTRQINGTFRAEI
jgi:hypothetical protein